MLSHEEGIEADMIKFLSAIPIFRRLFIAFAIAAVIPAVVIVLLSNFYLSSLTTRGQAVQTSFDAQSLASQQETNLQVMNALLKTSLNNIFAGQSASVNDPSLVASGGLIFTDITARESDFQEALATYQSKYELATSANMSNVRTILLNDNPTSGIIGDQQQALNAVMTTQWPLYRQLQDIVTKQLNPLENELLQGRTLSPAQLNQAYEQIYPAYYQANNKFTDLQNSWQRVADDAVSMGKTVTAVGPSETQPVLIATVISILGTIIIIIGTGWIVNLTITSPLRRLAALTRRISKGDTTARAHLVGRDEIYLVATSMNNMLDNIVRLIQDAQAQRDNLQAQVEKLVSEVSGVGEGDLRIQAEVTADALGVLADSFNYMVEELGSLVVRVKMVAQEVENSTTMTFERMSQLVETADMQIKQIAAAAIEIERMADSSRQVAERAQSLYSIAREARQTAETGRESVQQTVEGMGRIHDYVQGTSGKVQTLGERSREINNIVEVISTIAHQTNRLALDAAIQAAMAGENGKGFGAVAADIRRLAERAKDEASSVARIVRSVREDIGAVAVSMRDTERETSAGARLAQEAGASLESIFGVVERQAQEIENINQMAAQQLQSSSAVVQIMQGVSNSTRGSSASTRVVAQNMERLARLAEQLQASVEAFKLRENLNYYAPSGSVTITPENEREDRFSLSGTYRTITATAQPVGVGGYNAFPPRSNDIAHSQTPPYPLGRPGNGQGLPVIPNPQWQQQGGTSVPMQRRQPLPPPHRHPGNGQGGGEWQRPHDERRR
jgi:methyl-accepting chemotaxis protein